jgi:hypothetical protein
MINANNVKFHDGDTDPWACCSRFCGVNTVKSTQGSNRALRNADLDR